MRYCGQCGSPNTESARFCTNCGAKLSEPDAAPQSAQQSAPQSPAQEQTQAQAPSDNKNSGTVTALSIIGFICAFLIPIAGLILGIIDLCMNDGRKKGLSIAAVVISACIIGISIVTMLTIVIPISTMFGFM